MKSPKARVRAIAALACGLVAFAGCESDPSDPDAPWRNSADPVSTEGLAWASGSTVRLGDGTTIDTDVAVDTFVVAGDGVYFVADEDPEDGFQSGWGDTGELRYADRDGEVAETGVTVDVGASLTASPNGRYLAFFDMGSGQKDRYGTRQVEVVVWDLRTGEEIIRSTDGMGDPSTDDFAALYVDAEIHVLDLTDEELSVSGATDDWVFDLDSGSGQALLDAEPPERLDLNRNSPDGRWTLTGGRRGEAQMVEGPGGKVSFPNMDSARLRLYGWADDGSLLGVLDGDPQRLMICDPPEGQCHELKGAAGKDVTFEKGATGPGGFDLRSAQP